MATVPLFPPKPTISDVRATTVFATLNDPDNGGSAIIERQIGFSRDTRENPVVERAIGKTGLVEGLTPGIRYYFRTRMRNSVGWSRWGHYTGVDMKNVPDKPNIVTLSQILQTSVMTSFIDGHNGGSAILERQIGWNPTSDRAVIVMPTNTTTYSGPTRVTNLTPGRTYQFRARAKNAFGWGEWSEPSAATTIAGAYVKVGGVWKQAIPYVRVGGVWRVARPWGRHFGFWDETT